MSPADDDLDVPDTSELRTGHEPVDALLAELRAQLRREPVPTASVALARMLSEGFTEGSTAPSPAGLRGRVGALGLAAKTALAGGVVAVGVVTAGGAIALPGGPSLDDTMDSIVPGGDDDSPTPSVPASPNAREPGLDVPGTVQVPGLLAPGSDASGTPAYGPPPGLETRNPAAPPVPPGASENGLQPGDPEPPTVPPGLERPGAPAPGPPAPIPSVDPPAGPPSTIPSKAPATGPPDQAKKPVR